MTLTITLSLSATKGVTIQLQKFKSSLELSQTTLGLEKEHGIFPEECRGVG